MAISGYPSDKKGISNSQWTYTAVGGETTLSGYDSKGQPLQYLTNQEQFFLNGVMLVRNVDYTASTGTTITGLTALSASDFVEILTYSNFNVSTIPATQITGTVQNNQLQNNSITIGSNVISLGGTSTSISGLTIDGSNNTIRTNRGTTNPTTNLIAGDFFWNTTSNALQVYNGSGWTSFAPPAAPNVSSVTDVGTSRAYNNAAAVISFTPNNSGGVATQYFVTSTPGSFVSYGSSSPITLTGLASSTQYTFNVTAQGSFGNSSASSSVGPLTVTSVPQSPTIGTPSATLAVVSIPFTAGATGGSTITSYTATSSSGRTATGSASPLSITELSSGTYTYSVTATNANGTSIASLNSSGVTVTIPNVTGGILASDSTYYYRVFTGVSSLGVSGFSTPLVADVLTIAGGGGGGLNKGGGGGAGGIFYAASQTLSASSYTCTVGAGATGASAGNTNGNPGNNSQFGSLTAAVAGGYGATDQTNNPMAGGAGGSGGGGARGGTAGASNQTSTGGVAYGNAGGAGNNSGNGYGGGGGGGAGTSGSSGSSTGGGAGGGGTNAFSSWITAITNAMQTVSGWSTATSTGFIAGGGGGSYYINGQGTGSGGAGGPGGGANGAGTNIQGLPGTPNTGGGGGGTDFNNAGSSGGSGLIVVRWTKAQGG